MEVPNSTAGERCLRDSLTCYLCGELYRRPRILPCGHTFCSECLARIKDEILDDGKSLSSYEDTSREYKAPYHNSHDYANTPFEEVTDGSTGLQNGDITSSNVDGPVPRDGSISCYRPQQADDEVRLRHPLSSSLQRSRTFTSQRSIVLDRSPSRFSAPAGISSNLYGTPPTNIAGGPPRRTKSLHRSPNRSCSSNNSQHDRASSMPRWDSSSQKVSVSHLSAPACSFEQRHGWEMGQFVCPLPECGYSLRVMNLARWSSRNRTVSEMVEAWRWQNENKKDACCQTDITLEQSVIVTIPRSLLDAGAVVSPIGTRRRRHNSMVDMALSHAISMDSLQQQRGYIPRGHLGWKSYAAMVGMNILQQIMNL